MSRSTTDTILGFLRALVEVTLRQMGLEADPLGNDSNTLRAIPLDSRAVREKYRLNGNVTIYAVCPSCNCTYKPSRDPKSGLHVYPSKCTHIPSPGGLICSTQLLKPSTNNGIKTSSPIKAFVYHSIFDYISGLTSLLSTEEMLDQACDDLLRRSDEPIGNRTPLRNVFDGNFLRTFKGPNSQELFVNRGDEARLAFSLNMDFFNVNGVRAGGSSTSCGVISMACLNLPHDIRNKPENLYIAGIIPGPREPELERTNHYLKPLIDDMLLLWERGVHLSQTAKYPKGRIVRAAIATVVCDLPAARKAAGLASCMHTTMCSVCECKKNEMKNIGNPFRKRDVNILRREAENWLQAKTLAERDSIFNAHGTRWSELWRLPYWDPTQQLVIDPMHCLLEGLVHNHFRNILSLTSNSSAQPIDPAFSYDFQQVPHRDPEVLVDAQDIVSSMNTAQVKEVLQIHRMLVAPVTNDKFGERIHLCSLLARKHKAPLLFVCRSLGLEPTYHGTKLQFASALMEWVSTNTNYFCIYLTHLCSALKIPFTQQYLLAI